MIPCSLKDELAIKRYIYILSTGKMLHIRLWFAVLFFSLKNSLFFLKELAFEIIFCRPQIGVSYIEARCPVLTSEVNY